MGLELQVRCSVGCQVVVVSFFRMRGLRLRRGLVRRAACLRFIARGLCTASAPAVECVIWTVDGPNYGTVFVNVVNVVAVNV